MDYLAAMRAFVRSVDLGSFSKAAAEEDVKVSTISRSIKALETDLGAALLNRSTRSLHLTEIGKAFYERAVGLLSDLAEAREAATSFNSRPQGLLRVTIPGAFGRRHIVPHLKDFRTLYPEVRLDLQLTEATVDLIDGGIDVAVRIGALADSTLVARKLAPHRRLLVASPEYLQHYGVPAAPADLQTHRCLLFGLPGKDAWFFKSALDAETDIDEVKIHGDLRADDSDALLQAARDGLGVGLLPSWMLAEDIKAGRLVPLLSDWDWRIAAGPERSVWMVYPPKKTVSPKVRVFLDFLTDRVGKPPYWEDRLKTN